MNDFSFVWLVSCYLVTLGLSSLVYDLNNESSYITKDLYIHKIKKEAGHAVFDIFYKFKHLY